MAVRIGVVPIVDRYLSARRRSILFQAKNELKRLDARNAMASIRFLCYRCGKSHNRFNDWVAHVETHKAVNYEPSQKGFVYVRERGTWNDSIVIGDR